MHRIAGLADHFVYFNDDVFLTAPVTPEDFFQNGLPRDTCRFSVVHPRSADDVFAHILLNNLGVLNRHVDSPHVPQAARPQVVQPAKTAWSSVLRSLSLSLWPFFTGFAAPHLAVAYEKRTFEDLWTMEPQALDATCRRPFRTMADVSQLAARSVQLALGRFEPSLPLGVAFFPDGEKGVGPAARAIAQQKYRMVCVNDEDTGFDFEAESKRLIAAFERILPDKCPFER